MNLAGQVKDYVGPLQRPCPRSFDREIANMGVIAVSLTQQQIQTDYVVAISIEPTTEVSSDETICAGHNDRSSRQSPLKAHL